MKVENLFETVGRIAETSIHLLHIREPEKLKVDFKREIKELRGKGLQESRINEKYAEFEGEFGVVKKKIIHGRKLEPVYGADVVIEFPRERVIFIQEKLLHNNRFQIPRAQLLVLLKLCHKLCEYDCEIYFSRAFHHPIFFSHTCPCSVFYSFDFGNEKRYLCACDLSFVLGTRQSIKKEEVRQCTVPEDIFRKMLWNGEIGCKDLSEPEKEKVLSFYCEITKRVVFLLQVLRK